MKGYGKRRHWACCPGHDADWKHTRKRAVRKVSLRAVKKTARQQGKTEALQSNDDWASPHEVVREATAEDLRRRDEQARPRGVACDDPECWCRNA